MIIGLLEIKLSMPGNYSLKDKRMILRSLKDRVHQKFNVSIAEVGAHDKWCTALLAAAVVTSDRAHAHQVLESVVAFVRGRGDAVLTDYQIEMM